MNRISQLLDHSGPAAAAPAAVEQSQVRSLQEAGSHAVFVPVHYEANYAYPLIVWLHGPADDERQLQRIMPLVSMRNYVAVGPRGTLAAAHEEGGYAWSQSGDHHLLAEHRALDAIETASERFNIASGRIFLAGLHCGGTMALRIALDHPNLFAGALSLGGEFPSGQAPLRRLSEVRRLRIFLASGRDSHRYSPAAVCRDLRLFYTAGMNINLRQYPCGDELTTQVFSDMDHWIMEQLCPTSTPSASEAQERRG